MELFNSFIRKTEELLAGSSVRKWAYSADDCWPDTGRSELIMQREAAYELGGGRNALTFGCVTTDETLVGEDSVWLYGPDLGELKSDCDFARIVFFSVQDIGDEDEAFKAIQDIDFVKYHVFPRGYMVRALAEDCREQVRLSRSAVRDGVSFRGVGCDYIRKYREDPNVRSVRMIFVTDPAVDFRELRALAQKASEVTRSLNTIFKGIPTDCYSCGLKSICDEVEGMRELHFQQAGKKQN